MFAYCNNNPIIFEDQTGDILDTVLDIVSLGSSAFAVLSNPANPYAWAELTADVVCLALPGVTGGGHIVRFVANADKLADAAKAVDQVVDAAKAIRTTKEYGQDVHRMYMIGEKFQDVITNKTLGTIFKGVTSRLRPDGVDTAMNILYELKPYNADSFVKALNQTAKYLDKIQADRATWTVVIDMYLN